MFRNNSPFTQPQSYLMSKLPAYFTLWKVAYENFNIVKVTRGKDVIEFFDKTKEFFYYSIYICPSYNETNEIHSTSSGYF